MRKIGSRTWLVDLGFADWVLIADFLSNGWAEYQMRPALQESGLYAVVLGSDYHALVSASDRFYPVQMGPSGLVTPEVPNKSRPGQWRRRWWAVPDLQERWVEDADVVYLGKSDPELKKRLGQLRTFATGGLGHTGGQVLWHLRGYPENLEVGVLPLSKFPSCLPAIPRAAEKQLLAEFRSHYGQLPFANVIN
ncbi:MAG: hypothetical protein HYS09_01500 [Chloroflexi bacterium]|nr:hypothetical protein [Chloroflexota bacterium]